MAVASQRADKIEPSQTTEPTDAASETSDRNDSFTSSPNLVRDVDLQSPAALRSEEYRQLFRLPAEEVLIQDFNCAFQESILLQGHMYMFVHCICFYSNIFGFETKKIIPFHEVTCVRKAKTAGIFPNAIEILAGEKKYFFASFLSRDEAFKLINDGLLQHHTCVKAMTDQQELRSASQGNEIIEIERINSSNCFVSEFDSIERIEDTAIPVDPKFLPNGEDGIVSEILPEEAGNVEEVAEVVPKSFISSSSFRKNLWKQEDFDAPKIPEYYTKVAESKFLIGVEEFFTLFFSDDAVNFFESYHRKCGDKDVRCTSWYPHDKFGHTRDVSFRHPIKLYFGAKFGSCQEAQKFKVYRNSHLVIETLQEVSDAPYGDYFGVEGLWDVERDSAETRECCILTVYVNVAFSKKTMWRGKIVQATAEECREAFASWITIAHEFLKQRKLEKQEEGNSTANMIQNGQDEVETQGKSEGPSECSHEASDHFEDVSQGIVNSVRGSSIDATYLVSLLGKFVARLYLSWKSQSKISLLLVVVFAVILLMQMSILVLLSRPQEVHVISQADYLSATGSGLADRSLETVAWHERQIHHLKDEMIMVEARLEKMRHEHSLLKAQIEDLGRLRRQR